MQILRDNTLTWFNALNLVLGVAVLFVGSYKNALFLLVAILNTIISTVQEYVAKKTIDRLSIIASSKAKVLRDSEIQEIEMNQIVMDDILILNTGNQIMVDSEIVDGIITVDESIITGETDSITKRVGDTILSGSVIVSGKCKARVIHVAEENYTSKISSGAKYVKKINSEIMNSFNKIIKFIGILIIPVGIAMLIRQIMVPDATIQSAIISTVGSLIGMIPEGLALLTSSVLALGIIKLSRQHVLVQELHCIETLARVDTICMDKTGTLTEGKLEVKKIIAKNIEENEIKEILANICKSSTDENSTITALRDYTKEINANYIANRFVPFSSQTKWSGTHFKDKGTYIIGAPEMVLKESFDKYKDEVETLSQDYRLVAVAHSKNDFVNNTLPSEIELLGYVLILDKVRENAKETIKYFKSQGVELKVISGDNPITVSKIVKEVGINNHNKYIDMSQVKDEEIAKVASKYTVFGRVSPTQKKELILALQNSGRTVAMVGDGVNDVLSLKTADCSVAMANGADSAKNVSQMILMNSDFASMPKIVGEGRRIINNIQRSATLFLTKTIYSVLLALIFIIFMNAQYPFKPIQLTLISSTTIGIPSLILALEPNKERIKRNFLRNVIMQALPTALTIIVSIVVLTIAKNKSLIPDAFYSTLCVVAVAFSGILQLFRFTLKRKSEEGKLPISLFRLGVAIMETVLFIALALVFSDLFMLGSLMEMKIEILKTLVLSLGLYVVFNLISYQINKILIRKVFHKFKI